MNIINIISISFLLLYIESLNIYSQDIDPKEAFFRHLRFHNGPGAQQTIHIDSNEFENIPQPGGFQLEQRKKRSYHILPSFGLVSHFIQKKLPYNRIKRQMKTADYNENNYINLLIKNNRKKREPDERQTRGATKEQWIKQQYPVDVHQSSTDDNIPSATTNTNTNTNENIRAPRVHFVTTQRERHPVSVPFREREGRSRERDSIYPYPIYPTYPTYPAYPTYPTQPHPYYPQVPRPRNYEPSYRYNPPRYYEPYYDDQDRERRYSYNMDPSREQHKQRRIIYYATLPEVVRTHEQRYHPNWNWRDPDVHEYDTRTRYYTNQIPSQKHREHNVSVSTLSVPIKDQKKTPLFPIQVSTDVNVRESNKNPERRIFSEIDSRFTYKSPEDVHF